MYRKLSGLFIRPVYAKRVNIFYVNIHNKDFMLPDCSKTKIRIKNDTKLTNFKDVEQKELYHIHGVSRLLMKEFSGFYGNFMILQLDYQEENIKSTLLIGYGEDQENTSLTDAKLILLNVCTTDMFQPPRCSRLVIVNNALESVSQCYKIFYPFFTDSPSSCKMKLNYFGSKFWFHSVSVRLCFTLLPIFETQREKDIIPNTVRFLKTHSILNIVNNINLNLMIKEKDFDHDQIMINFHDHDQIKENCSLSTIIVYIFCDHERLYWYIFPLLQEYVLEGSAKNQTYVLLKGCSVDKLCLHTYYLIWNTSVVSRVLI